MSTLSNLIAQCLVTLFVALVANGRPSCDITDASANECGKKMIFIGEHSANIPKDDTEMKSRCNDINEGLQCLKKYTKSCLDPFATQLMKVVVKNGDKMEDKYCKNDAERGSM